METDDERHSAVRILRVRTVHDLLRAAVPIRQFNVGDHADDAQMVFDVGNGLLQSEGLDVVADVDTLVEGFETFQLQQMV